MRARLIRTAAGNLEILCADGSVCKGTPTMLYNFITNFKHAKSFSGVDGHWTDVCKNMDDYPGTTLGFIDNSGSLTLKSITPFRALFTTVPDYSDYISVEEFAAKYHKSTEIVKVYCRKGRIAGAVKISNVWLIPREAPYPIDPQRQKEGVRGRLGARGIRRPLVKPVDPSDNSYVSVEQYAEEHNRSATTITRYCRKGRFPDARKGEGGWELPRNAPYPVLNSDESEALSKKL